MRTKRDGGWVDLDATLVKAPDGTLRPKASSSGLILSGGGTAPLATLDQDGKQLVLGWPEPLPAPVLEGASAVYREVVPGTDLKVTADVGGGISQILVVKSAEAAKNPKLAKLTMGLKGQGVAVSADEHGNLKAADASGRTVFRAPTPTMWDSTAAVKAPLAKASSTAAFSQSVVGAVDAPSGATDAGGGKSRSDSDGPGSFAKSKRLQADLGKDSIALAPDRAFLTDPATAYPVFIDPAWVPVRKVTQHWGWVQEALEFRDVVHYDGSGWDPGVGYQRWSSPKGLERYYVQLDTGDLNDKIIKKAAFSATQSYAADNTCGNTYNVDLHSTEPLPSNISWNNQPRDWEVLRTSSLNSAGGRGCSGSSTLGEWDVRDHLAANMWRGSVTYALFASNEGKNDCNNALKRFSRTSLPYIYVEYNRPPQDPQDLEISPAPKNPNGSNGCGWVGATAYAGMSLSAWTSDPDNQATSARFMVYNTNGSGAAYDSGFIGEASDRHKVSAYPTGLADGNTYQWQVQTLDGELGSAWVQGCRFALDTQPPSVPVVTSAEYPPSGTLPGSTKYTGQSGTFKVASTDTLSGVQYYEWAFNSAIPVGGANRIDAVADGSASIPLTPATWGTNVLRVQAVDRAGNRSQQQTYTFYVPDNPNAKTTLGDITGDERVDFIAPADNGDLIVYPTANDPAAGGVLASTKANSPSGLGWGNGTLTTHRGGNGITIDDLWVWRDGQMKVYRNSLSPNQGGLAANGGLYFTKAKSGVVTRPAPSTCTVAATGALCTSDNYASNWSGVKQILAMGDAKPIADVPPLNDLLTVESDSNGSRLLLFQGKGPTGALEKPLVLVLSPSGWDNLTLIAPGDATGDGLEDLWARDNTTGDVYQYANEAGNPAALGDHTKRTKISSGLPASTFPVIGSSGDTSADGVPDLWALDGQHRLRTWNGVATSGKVTGFTAAQTMGDARISTAHWKLNEDTGTAADLRARNNAALSATGATRVDDTVAGSVSKVVDLNGTTGTVTAAGPAVDTSKSFTVSAWAKTTIPGTPGVVLSQDGQRTSGFALSYDADGYWRFAMSRKDDDTNAYDETLTRNEAAKAQPGVWTQLTGTYDATTGLIALYVNGTYAASGYHAPGNVWNATGPFIIGRGKQTGTPGKYFAGRVSNVTVYDHSTVPSATHTQIVSGVTDAKCADDPFGSNTNNNNIHIWDCSPNPGDSQLFDIRENGELRIVGKCLDLYNSGRVSGTPVVLWDCDPNGVPNQRWLPTANAGFYNPAAGRCLDLPASRTNNGTRLEIHDCHGANNQRWTATGLTTPLGAAG
ncbi:ricin-type beta-trefoil lectin domain protein [Streptomyces sp. NPDC054956]